MLPPTQPPPDLECWRCGYDLRGIEEAAGCPECGVPAENSRKQQALYGLRRDIQMVRRGCIALLLTWWLGGACLGWVLCKDWVHEPTWRWGMISLVAAGTLVSMLGSFWIGAPLGRRSLNHPIGGQKVLRWVGSFLLLPIFVFLSVKATWSGWLTGTIATEVFPLIVSMLLMGWSGRLFLIAHRVQLRFWSHSFRGMFVVFSIWILAIGFRADLPRDPSGVLICLQLVVLAGLVLWWPIALLGLHNTLGLLLAPPPHRFGSDGSA